MATIPAADDNTKPRKRKTNPNPVYKGEPVWMTNGRLLAEANAALKIKRAQNAIQEILNARY